MKVKPSKRNLLSNKKTTPPTARKISKPKSFKAKSKTPLSNKLTSTPCTSPKDGKKELSAHTGSSKKNKKISPELNLGLKIEKILENGGPNVIKLSLESDSPKTSTIKKKKAKKEGPDEIEVSSKSELRSPKKEKKRKRNDEVEGREVYNQHKEKEKPTKPRKNQFVLHPDDYKALESDTPKTATFKKKKAKKEGPDEIEVSSKNEFCTPKKEKRKHSDDYKALNVGRRLNAEIDKQLEREGEIMRENLDESSSSLVRQCNLDNGKVLNVVRSLKDYMKKKHEESKNPELFDGDTEPVCLQISTLKKAVCPKIMLRFCLPHPLVHDLTDICLIVPDKKGNKSNPEAAIEFYQQLLADNNVTNIKEIIPLKMLRREYSQYEMRHKLCNRFDVFLTDARVSHYLVKLLGRDAAYTRKHPIPVRLNHADVKEKIRVALSKTQMKIDSNSNTFNVVVGHMGQSAEEITANILAVAEGLTVKLPGNWPNVRALYIRTLSSITLPVYMSLLSPNAIPVPIMERRKKKGDEIVEGELSTMLDAVVRVKPSGQVTVRKDHTQKSSLSDNEDEEILALVKKHREEARSAGIEDEEKSKSKNKNDKILQKAEEKFVKLYKGNLNDVDIDDDEDDVADDEDDMDDDSVDGGNVERGSDIGNENEINTKPKKRKSSTHVGEARKAKKAKKSSAKDEEDVEDEPKVKQKKPKSERVAKTNWIKSTKKGRSKKLSKSQRKAKIKTKNLKKSKN